MTTIVKKNNPAEKTTTAIAQGCAWCRQCLLDSFSSDGGTDVYEWSRRVVARFHELCASQGYPELTWIPQTSEVIGYWRGNYDDIDLTETLEQAKSEIWEQFANA